MQAINTQFEQYNLSHHNFIEAYKMVNEYVAELYRLPQKLVEETSKVIDSFCCEETTPNGETKIKNSCKVVIDFMDQLDEFTLYTIQLFNEHKKHVNATRAYIRKVSALQTKCRNISDPLLVSEYNELAVELSSLLNGLKLIKDKADNMVSRLEKLELRWDAVRVNMN